MLIFGYNPKEVIKKYNDNNKLYKIGAFIIYSIILYIL